MATPTQNPGTQPRRDPPAQPGNRIEDPQELPGEETDDSSLGATPDESGDSERAAEDRRNLGSPVNTAGQSGQRGQPGQAGQSGQRSQAGQQGQSGQSGQQRPSDRPGQSGQPNRPGQSGQSGQQGQSGRQGQSGQSGQQGQNRDGGGSQSRK